MDGNGNRVSALIAGVNKNIAAPLNAVRVGHATPCSRTGFCDDDACAPPGRLCSQLTVIEASRTPGRIAVVLVGEVLGF